MIRKGDIGGQSSESRARVNLGVGVGVAWLLDHVVREHGDVGGLGLARINILDQVVPLGARPEKQVLPILQGAHLRQKLSGLVRRNVPKGLRIEEGTKHPPRLRGDPDLPKGCLPDNSRLNMNPAAALGLAELSECPKRVRRRKSPDPGAIEEQARRRVLLHDGSGVERLQRPDRIDILAHSLRIAVNAHVRRARHVLHYANRMTLWSL